MDLESAGPASALRPWRGGPPVEANRVEEIGSTYTRQIGWAEGLLIIGLSTCAIR
jgi:hypothetical protein